MFKLKDTRKSLVWQRRRRPGRTDASPVAGNVPPLKLFYHSNMLKSQFDVGNAGQTIWSLEIEL